MPYNRRCPICGAYLDPCERCQCQQEQHHTHDLEEAQPHTVTKSTLNDRQVFHDNPTIYRRYAL